MKLHIELVTDGEKGSTKFLNYWDYNKGDDVCCEDAGDKLFILEYDNEGNELPKREISLSEFIHMAEDRAFGE